MRYELEWDEEEQEWVCTSPDAPYLTGFGETKEEAITELRVVTELAKAVNNEM